MTLRAALRALWLRYLEARIVSLCRASQRALRDVNQARSREARDAAELRAYRAIIGMRRVYAAHARARRWR